ncbi:MAG: ABC transporter permease [Halanaerobiales bacterium]|nr:ABC transporter permease [Halanaerobiales bacterium]
MKLLNSYIEEGKVVIEKGNLRTRIKRWFQVYWNIAFIRWANIRNEWYFHIFLAPLMPLGILVFMKLSGAIVDPGIALYVTAGNAIMGLIMGPMQSISNDFAWGRQRNDLDYFATLPFSKLQLILGFSTMCTIFTVPGMLMTLFVGKLWLKFPIVFHPMMILVMIISGLSMVGLGVLFGVYARNGHHANMMNNVTMMIVMFLSPVLIPKENLPVILQYTSKILPTSYAADAFRSVLSGVVDKTFAINMVCLGAFTVIMLYFAVKKLDWRVE